MSGRPRLVKLVRDRIGEFVGDSTVSYEPIPDPAGGVEALRLKLLEEAVEYLRDPCVEELADVLAVVQALASRDLGCDWLALEHEADAKAAERGGFEELVGMYVQTTAPDRHEAVGRCGLVMVGSGTDMYDPLCELPAGHDGTCKSTAAIDQHRLRPACDHERARLDDPPTPDQQVKCPDCDEQVKWHVGQRRTVREINDLV